MRVLVTGASGFLGNSLVSALMNDHFVISAARSETKGANFHLIPDLNYPFDWCPLLKEVDAIVHLAGIAHRRSTEEELDKVNNKATKRLCEAAASSGVKHFVFISSIAAQSGPSSRSILTENDDPRPTTPYGRSKLAAEGVVKKSGVPFTILRPVAVEGKCAKGNIGILHKIASLPVPLPIGGITAKRSVLSLQNFNTAVMAVLGNDKTFGQTFIVADPKPLTVSEMVSSFRESQGLKSRIFAIPESMLQSSFSVFGLTKIWQRIGESLIASPQKLLSIGWKAA